jgi:hypothetical protein
MEPLMFKIIIIEFIDYFKQAGLRHPKPNKINHDQIPVEIACNTCIFAAPLFMAKPTLRHTYFNVTTIVFEKDYQLYTYNVASKKTEKINISTSLNQEQLMLLTNFTV